MRAALVGLTALLLLAPGGAQPVQAGPPDRAGLAVVFGDGTTQTRCIELQGGTMAGSEFLASSGLELNLDPTHGGGITVCRIEGTGCDFPVDACFCECMGNGPCRYWNYFYRQAGQQEWVYSPLGALLHEVPPGSVEAWVWGDGHTPPDAALTFDAICGAPQAEPLPTPREAGGSPTPRPSLTPAGSPEETSLQSPGGRQGEGSELEPALSPGEPSARDGTGAPQAGQAGGAAATPAGPQAGRQDAAAFLGQYWPFGVMVLVLAGVATYLRAGRRA